NRRRHPRCAEGLSVSPPEPEHRDRPVRSVTTGIWNASECRYHRENSITAHRSPRPAAGGHSALSMRQRRLAAVQAERWAVHVVEEVCQACRVPNKTGPPGRERPAQGFGRRPMPWVRVAQILRPEGSRERVAALAAFQTAEWG